MPARAGMATVTKKAAHRGEHEGNRQTIARGKPVRMAEPVVTTLVCVLSVHTRLRVRQAPGFSCALCGSGCGSEGQRDAATRAKASRGIAGAHPLIDV